MTKPITALPLKDRFFEIIDNVLYVFENALKEAGLSVNYYRKEKSQGNKRIQFLDHPRDNRVNLYGFESMSEAHQAKITQRFGNPYEFVAIEPIKALVKKDAKAEEYYRRRLLELKGDAAMISDYVIKYTTAASWLNMLLSVDKDPSFVKKTLNLPLNKFYENVRQITETERISIPTNYRKLRAKMKEYQEYGYEILIDWRFGNKLAAKIGKTEEGYCEQLSETQTAIIRAAASKHNNFDSAQITRGVNILFQKQGWLPVSETTVRNIIKANEHLVLSGRRGKREYHNKISMQITRQRTQAPLFLCSLDGWTVELLYQGDGPDGYRYDRRLVMVVVLDVMNNYPVGYAIGERENADLIQQALRNSIVHINEIFGDYYRPHQLQSDNYAIKQNTPFYEAFARISTPAAVGNAKAKPIEPYFKYLNKTYCQYQPNLGGFNIDAKKDNQPNREYLNATKHSFPTKEGVIAQINKMMQTERSRKIEAYRGAWMELADTEKLKLQNADLYFLFGKHHRELNSITGAGLVVTLNGTKLIYDSFDPVFRENQHLKWKVVYNEEQFDQVMAISEDGKIRTFLHQKRILPMDLHSTTSADHQYRSLVNQFNTIQEQKVIDTFSSDAEKVNQVLENTTLSVSDPDEAALKLMFTVKGQQKERLQDAKRLRSEAKQLQKAQDRETQQILDNNVANQVEYMKSKIDFENL